MKSMTVGDFKSQFSKVIELVRSGEEVEVTFGKNKELIGKFIPSIKRKKRRKIGLLEGKGKIEFIGDFKITTDEFLGL